MGQNEIPMCKFGEEKYTVRLNVAAKLCILGEVIIVKKNATVAGIAFCPELGRQKGCPQDKNTSS